jgi:hypothetical protein
MKIDSDINMNQLKIQNIISYSNEQNLSIIRT